MTTFFGAIADDFTGATDLAAMLARSNVAVSLRLGVPINPPKDTSQIEIIALKCRTSPVADAVAEARSALDWLRAAGAKRFFWKYCSTFDSTTQGNIGPVAEALMADLGIGQTIYCPAFPENGRSVYMGNLFVAEAPLAESPMKDHPLTPMRDSNLMRLLDPQVTKAVGLANRLTLANLRERLNALAALGVAHVVVDAICNEDLQIIANACQWMPLLTGGSALAAHLPPLWQARGLMPKQTTPDFFAPSGSAVVLSGSCSTMTNDQVANYIAAGNPAFRLDPLELAAHGPQAALDWLAGDHVSPLIYATTTPDAVAAAQAQLGVERAGQLVEQALAVCAVAARDRGVRRFVVAGGETAGAVAKALGIAQLSIGPEIAAGVPWCAAISGGYPIAITLKSGNFGTAGFFADALGMLDR